MTEKKKKDIITSDYTDTLPKELFEAWYYLAAEFIKEIKQGRARQLLNANDLKEFVKVYKQLGKISNRNDIEQWFDLLQRMSKLARNAREQKLISKLAYEGIIRTAELSKALVNDSEVKEQVMKVFDKFEKLCEKHAGGKDDNKVQVPESAWGSKEYREFKNAILEKPGLAARVFKDISGRLAEFLSEQKPGRILRQVELLVGTLKTLRSEKALGIPAKVEMEKVLKAIAEHTNAALKNVALDEQKVFLGQLDPGTLALILSTAKLEVKKLFERSAEKKDGAVFVEDVLLSDGSMESLTDLENILKEQKQVKDPSALGFRSWNEVKDAAKGGELQGMTFGATETQEMLGVVDKYIAKIAGEDVADVSAKQLKKGLRMLRFLTALAVRSKSKHPDLRSARRIGILVLRRIAQKLVRIPEGQAEQVLSKLPKSSRKFIADKMAQLKQEEIPAANPEPIKTKKRRDVINHVSTAGNKGKNKGRIIIPLMLI
ncbi:hypothetical protein ACFL4D_03310 [Candidatus Margulisiibacteriota bacterium]